MLLDPKSPKAKKRAVPGENAQFQASRIFACCCGFWWNSDMILSYRSLSMADPPNAPNERDELRTWGEIAEYLGVSIRTAQEWEEKHGLPVYRLSGKKARVWARRRDLDAWKENTSGLSAEAKPVGRDSGWGRLLRARFLAAGLALVSLAALGAYLALIPKGPPANLRAEGNELVVMNRRGHELWRHQFPHPLMTFPYADEENLRFTRWFGDLDGDGRIELLFVYNPVVREDFGVPLYCFTEAGRVKWRFAVGTRIRNLEQIFNDVYFSGRFLVSATGKVIVGSAHYYSYPFQIAVLDSEGKLLSEYWHTGHVGHLQLADLDGDGTEEILAAGVNNAFGQATLIVLELGNFHGASLTPPDSPLQFPDLVPAAEKAVVFFPKSCITEKFEPFSRAAGLRVTSELIELQVFQTHRETGPYLVYQLNRNLEVLGLTVSDIFENRHKELEAEGKLDHSLSSAEIERLKQIRVVRGR
jgi:excisionase family DNA binding protein